MNDNMNVEVELPDVGAPEWMNAATPEGLSATAEAMEQTMQSSFEEQEREEKARELEERKQRETMQRGYEALSVGWGNPHEGAGVKAKRRKAAVDAFGEEYVTMYEQAPAPEQKRAVADRFLTDYYTEAGDEIFSPELRFAEACGIDPNSDIKEHIYQRFIEASQMRHEFDTRIDNMREEEMQWIGRYLAGNEEMTAEKSELIVGLFGQEMVERIAKVRDASQLIEEFVKQGEGEEKTSGVLKWEDAALSAIVDQETGKVDELNRTLMELALHGIAEDVQESERETWALQAGKDSADTAIDRLRWNVENFQRDDLNTSRRWLALLNMADSEEGRSKLIRSLEARKLSMQNVAPHLAMLGLPQDIKDTGMENLNLDKEGLRRIREVLLPAARENYRQQENRMIVRGMLQDYVAKADASPEGTSWYKQALKGAGEMAGSTAPYLIPYLGIYVGSAVTMASGYDYNLNANKAQGLSLNAAQNRAKQDAGIATLVELMPWSRVGGRGFNATIGRSLQRTGYKPGAFASKMAEFASRGTGHAAATEFVGGVVDEGILEPLGQGLLTMTTDAAMDALGVEHGSSRSFGEAFSELREVWTNPTQLASLVLFTGALTGARLPQMHRQSKKFTQFLRDNAALSGTWEALGLTDAEVRQTAASDNPLLTGRAFFKAALENDPEGLKARMRKQGARLQEEGFTLKITGTTGELDANAEAAWAEAYRERVELGYMPHVERIADKDGLAMFRITERNHKTKEVTSEQEMAGAQADTYLQLRMAQADAIMYARHKETVYGVMAEHVNQLTGAAMGRELEQKGAAEGLTTQDMNELGEGIGEQVQAAGFLTFPALKLAAEKLAGKWAERERRFRERSKIAEEEGAGTAAFREHSGIRVSRNGRSVIGSMIMHAKGNARPIEYAEESIESFSDMWIQLRAQEAGISEQEALAELADIVRRAREELLKLEPGLKISAVPENASYLHVIEAMSDMGRARFINSPLLPAWMAQVQDMVSAAVEEAAMATRIHEAAKQAEKEGLPAWQQMEEIFKSFDVPMGNIYSAARIDAQIIEQVRLARARIGGRQVATTAAEVQDKQAEDAARDEQMEREEAAYAAACPEPPKAEGKSPEEQKADILAATPGSQAPSGMRGVFVNDACAPAEGANGVFYVGMVPVKSLRDSKEVQQVKAGGKGKHGVVNPITGEYQLETEAIYVWRREDGTLEVISGRHKYALALENGTEAVICYVFNEDAQHDAKWARLLDFENNMRGDQADELTAAIYVRETGYDDATLRKKGLMRNKSKSKRGILIGREARQELWDRFVNGAVNAMDAETICTMTQNVRDKSRVEEIQRRCCMLLEQKKSWEYISAMVQLMANKESVFMKQGLLDLGADFEADMERAAKYVEKCVKQLNAAIKASKQGERLSGEEKEIAARMGTYASTSEDSAQLRAYVVDMLVRYQNIGAYPDLVAEASMWDGKSPLDPVGKALAMARQDMAQTEEEKSMSREEWEQAQVDKAAKQAAEEATGSLFGSFSLREMKSVRDCVDELAAGNKSGTLRNTAWGHDILVPMGVGGSGGYGVKHMHGQRMKQGFNSEEAAFLLVCALKAAEVGHPTPGVRNKVYFDKFGVRAIVAQDHGTGKSFVTGYILDTREKVKADETEDALRAQQFYALDDLRRNQEVGAALRRSVDKLEAIIKQNPRRWEEIVSFEVEKLRIKHNTKAKGTFMKAPNGQPTKLTEQQWLTAQTEAFKAWFGDWENDPENASKVLDENGEPLVVYHGSQFDFTAFDKERQKEGSKFGKGFYFTDDYDRAKRRANPLFAPPEMAKREPMAVFLNIRDENDIHALKGGKWTEYVAHEPTQIKSATDNRGTFDPQNADITFSVIGERARTWSKYKDKAFSGRDDGKLRAELDASEARLRAEKLPQPEVSSEAFRRALIEVGGDDAEKTFSEYTKHKKAIKEIDYNSDDWLEKGEPLRRRVKELEGKLKELVIPALLKMGMKPQFEAHVKLNAWRILDYAAVGYDFLLRNELNRAFMRSGIDVEQGDIKKALLDTASPQEAAMLEEFWDILRREQDEFEQWEKDSNAFTPEQEAEQDARHERLLELEMQLQDVANRALMRMGYMDMWMLPDSDAVRESLHELILRLMDTQLNFQLAKHGADAGKRLDAVLDFPELFRAYPQLGNIRVADANLGLTSGLFSPSENCIYVNLRMASDAKEVRKIILHEVQHAIQRIEGFARGGSPDNFRVGTDGLVNIGSELASGLRMKADRVWDSVPSEVQDKFRDINLAIIKKEYERVADMEDALNEEERAAWEEYRYLKTQAQQLIQDGGKRVTPMEAYQRLGGEIEARNVERRMEWGAEKRAETPFNDTLEYSDGVMVTFSLRSMTESARVVLRRREDDVEGEELIKRWDDLLARFETASTDKHDGAAQLGTLVSLLEATRSVLPPDYAKLGRLTALMKWASVYAHMVSTGEVKRDGVLKGEIFEKFVAAMKREYEGGLLKGLSEEEAREAVQSIGERRLEDALIKVANECRARLDAFVKARARERIELMAERACPKKERGQKSPRGKMEAIYYRAMNTMLEWMDAPTEKVVARVNELHGRLDALDAAGVDAEDKGATREELEEELRIVQLYGCWADMSAAQAKQAAEDFVTFVLTQRHKWDARLEMERRRRDYQRLRMRFTQPYNSNTRSDQKRKDSNWKVHKFSIKSLLVNTMSYAQLMLAGRKVFGEQFVRLRLQEIADANAALRNARRDRDNFFARAVMEATGLSGEGELSRWLNKFAKVETKTGIFKREITHHTLEMERREAEEWCAMTAEERAERRAELEKEAAATGLAPSNVPSESDIDLLRKELAALDERESTAQKVKVRVPRYGQKIELVASRDAVANAILLLEQEDYQHLIEYEGFVPRDKNGKVIDRELFPDEPLDVEQTLKPLYDFIGKEGRAFAYALRRYVGQNGKQMQAVYEAQMGIPLAMKPNYWRGNFNINTIKEKDTLSESNGAVGGGGYGFLIDRVRHYNRLEWSNTATMVFGATVEMQNNYTYTSGITREWRALLSETGFQKRLEVELGRNYMTALKAWLEVIDKSKGGFAAFADIATWTQRMSRGLAYAALAGNGFVLLKQSSAILHGLMGGEVPRAVVERGDGVRELTWRKIGAAEYAAAMARTKAGMGAISLKELADSEWFQARADAEYKNVASRMSKLEGQKQHAYATKVAEKSMDAIGWVDRAVNLMGMQALADAVYRDMARLNKESELGLTEEQMKGEALAAVGRALTLAAQPNEASEKSLFAAQGGLISNMLFQFKSETVNKLGLLIARCYAGDWVAGIRDYMTFGAMNTLIAAALAWLRYGDEPEEDEEWKYFTKYGLNMLTGDLAAMPLVGEMVQSATSAVTGEYVYQRGFIANYIDPRGIWRSAERLATGEKGKKEMDWHGYVAETNALARRLGVLCAFLGEGATWAELMLSAASAGNILRTGADVANGVTREEDE